MRELRYACGTLYCPRFQACLELLCFGACGNVTFVFYVHVHVHVVTANGVGFVLSVCAYCLFSLSLQSKTTPFTYSAHCNSSVRFIPVRLNEVSGMPFLVNQICGSKLLGNCCNNQCIVACMDIYRQVTNFTDILCPFCFVYEVLNVLGRSVLS